MDLESHCCKGLYVVANSGFEKLEGDRSETEGSMKSLGNRVII